MDATLRMIGHIDPKGPPNPELNISDVIIYVGQSKDDPNGVKDAIGYHDMNHQAIPYGFVLTDIAEQAGEPWTVTLSHEVLELIADPDVNLMVLAPHPKGGQQPVLRPYEVCDPVQSNRYQIDGVPVSNFVTPQYFAQTEHPMKRTNFLNVPLQQFGLTRGGYFSYLDLSTGKYETEFDDKINGPKVAELKQSMGSARRQARRIKDVQHLLKQGK
jgi:hypothetical protein